MSENTQEINFKQIMKYKNTEKKIFFYKYVWAWLTVRQNSVLLQDRTWFESPHDKVKVLLRKRRERESRERKPPKKIRIKNKIDFQKNIYKQQATQSNWKNIEQQQKMSKNKANTTAKNYRNLIYSK